MTDVPAMTKAERVMLLAELEGLTDDQWSTMTVCAPWTVRHLVAHITALGNQTVPHFMTRFVGNGFNVNKFMNKDLARFNQGSNADVLARFAKTVEHPTSVPGLKTCRSARSCATSAARLAEGAITLPNTSCSSLTGTGGVTPRSTARSG